MSNYWKSCEGASAMTSIFSLLLQLRNTERLVAIHRQVPINPQFFVMNFDPRRHEFGLLHRYAPAKNCAVGMEITASVPR